MHCKFSLVIAPPFFEGPLYVQHPRPHGQLSSSPSDNYPLLLILSLIGSHTSHFAPFSGSISRPYHAGLDVYLQSKFHHVVSRNYAGAGFFQ